jgi:hypothetical protein
MYPTPVNIYIYNILLKTLTGAILETLLRKDLSMKERQLRIRPITWVFDPVSWRIGVALIMLSLHPSSARRYEKN